MKQREGGNKVTLGRTGLQLSVKGQPGHTREGASSSH